jgi:hypothetical protein
MREILAGRLWLGNALDARDPRALFDVGIAAVVDLAYEEPPAQLPRSLAYCRIPLTDGAGNDPKLLRLALDTLQSLLSTGVPTLVACGAGMSRSPCIAAAALAVYHGASPDETLRSLLEHEPHDVSPAFWNDVVRSTKPRVPGETESGAAGEQSDEG